MKYILSRPGEEYGIYPDRYFEYVETIRNSLPAHIYEFASSEKYFTLNSPHSLHDSWLNSVEIRESHGKETDSVVGITLKLLGQLHNRIIILDYKDVAGYSLTGKKNPYNYADTFHGDVFTHEIRLSDAGNLIHEILFQDSTFTIECKDFTHREEIIQN